MRFKICSTAALFAAMAFLLHACKKDPGSYSYVQLADFYIDTAGIKLEYEIPYAIGQIQISPSVVYQGEGALSYRWTLYGGAASGIDTLSTAPALDKALTHPLGNYTLELSVTEDSGGRSVFQRFTVKVVPPYVDGFMVAHERDGTFDIDFLRAPEIRAEYPDTLIRAIYFKVNGSRIPGKPAGFVQLASRTVYPATVNVVSDAEGNIVDVGTFARIFDFQHYFYDPVFRPDTIRRIKGVINNNGIVMDNAIVYPGFTATPQISGLGEYLDDSGIEISDVMPIGNTSTIYDEKNNRFLSFSSAVLFLSNSHITVYEKANATARFSLDSIGPKKLLYLKRGFNNGSGTVLYAVFKDKLQADARYLYAMKISSPAAPDQAALDISSVTGIQQAVAYEVVTNAPVVFYATKGEVGRILINVAGNSYQASQAGFNTPPGEEITSMKLYNDTKLFVATWNAASAEGHLYLLPVGNGGAIGSPLRTWRGFDKIMLMETKTR